MSEREIDQAIERELVALQRRRLLLPMALPTMMISLLATALLVSCAGRWLGECWRGERAWTGERQFVPAVYADGEITERIDWRLLHERLLPRWGLGLGWGRGSTEEQRAFDAVWSQVRADPNLAGLITELREVARTNAARGSQRVEYLAWAWNNYLSKLGVPWYLECNVITAPGSNRLLLRSYRIQGRTTARVGTRTYPLLILDRADHLGGSDRALGRTRAHDGLGQVLVDGVREQAQGWVWPLLAQLAPPHGVDDDAEFAPAVAAELRATLRPEHLSVLTRTASSYNALLTLRASLLARQESGSPLRIKLPPPRGYAPEFLLDLERMAQGQDDLPCPAITLLEADQIDFESEALAQASELPVALAALTEHLVRGVAIHEARHLADEDQAHAFRQPLQCSDCPSHLGTAARAEISAYLASFADERTGVSSLYQACHVARTSGANAVALGYLLPQLLPGGCSHGPPSDLQARARQLDRALFGRSQPVLLEPTLTAPPAMPSDMLAAFPSGP